MEFTTVKELYRNKDAYLDKKISFRHSKTALVL